MRCRGMGKAAAVLFSMLLCVLTGLPAGIFGILGAGVLLLVARRIKKPVQVH